MENCTRTQLVLRYLNNTGTSTIDKIVEACELSGTTISKSSVNKILNKLYDLEIIEYYGLQNTKALTWETNNIWEHYISESRKQDLMGYYALPELVRLSVSDNYVNQNMLVKYNDNLYRIASFKKITVNYDRSELDEATMQPLPHIPIKPNTTLVLQLLSLEEENKVRHDNRNVEIYKLPRTN